MCGIVGYVGRKVAEPILVEGLRRLEYRGYDSSGLATLTGSRLHLRKQAGRIHDLVRRLRDQPAPGCVGISHTRWATHGPANDRNAHPHLGGDGLVALVHNGVIENYTALKRQMESEGVAFHSDTNTEVVAQLIAHHLRSDGGGSRRFALDQRFHRRRQQGVGSAQGDLRPGRSKSALSGRGDRGAAGQPAGPRHRRPRELPGERPRRPGRQRRPCGLPARSPTLRPDAG